MNLAKCLIVEKCLVPKKKTDIALQIILHLKKADRPLIANHIATAINARSSLVDYHLKKLICQGIVLTTTDDYGHYYLLQPSFYLEEAELALMNVLTPWIQEFAKQTEVTEEMSEPKEQVVYANLKRYFEIFFWDSFQKNR